VGLPVLAVWQYRFAMRRLRAEILDENASLLRHYLTPAISYRCFMHFL
jgi:hypothetical protein